MVEWFGSIVNNLFFQFGTRRKKYFFLSTELFWAGHLDFRQKICFFFD